MARQFLNPAPVLHDVLGIDPAFNGSLTFYEIGTTDPKDTWSDHDMTILNENPVPLDSSARTDTQVWLNGEYTAVLRNAAGEVVWTRDLRPEQAGGDALPAKEAGKFLTTDGTNWLLEEIVQVPDPAGFNGRLLSTDGANLLWVAPQEIPEPDEPSIVIGNKIVTIGMADAQTAIVMMCGTDSAPATSARDTTKATSFAETFQELWHIAITQTHNGVTANSFIPAQSITAQNNSGFTVRFTTEENSTWPGWNITSPVPYSWFAIGTVVQPE